MAKKPYRYRKVLPEYEPIMRVVVCMKCQQDVELPAPRRICNDCTYKNRKSSKREGLETGGKRHHGTVAR